MATSETGASLPSGLFPDDRQQELLARYALNQLRGTEQSTVETLLKISPQARKLLEHYRKNLPDNAAVAQEEGPIPADSTAHPPDAPDNHQEDAMVWNKLVPAAGVAAVVLASGVLWGIQHPSSRPIVESPSPMLSSKSILPSLPLRSVESGEPASAPIVQPVPPTDIPPGPDSKPVVVSPALSQILRSESVEVAPASSDSDTLADGNTSGTNPPATLKFPLPSHLTVASTPSPIPAPAPVEAQEGIINFTHVGATGFKAVRDEPQWVRKSASLGFFIPELNLSAPGQSSASRVPMVPNVFHDSGLVSVDYSPEVASGPPFKIITQMEASPWNPGRQLVLVGVRSVPVTTVRRVPANLAFLIDVSDSMADSARLPILRNALLKFVEQLGAEDRVGIVLYSGAATELLPSTSGADQAKIYSALYSLQTYPGTANGPGIQTAYGVVQAHYLKDAVNRVIVMTDGDLNFGLSAEGGLMEFVDRQSRDGIGLSLIGVGEDILQDPEWKTLMRLGHGTYSQVSTTTGAMKVMLGQLRKQITGTSASDVKVELSVNGDQVKSYRLLGYENQWPQNPAPGTKPGGDQYVVSLYEIDPAEGGLMAHPMEVKASYRANHSTQEQFVSAIIPQDSLNGDSLPFNIKSLATQFEEQQNAPVNDQGTIRLR